MEEKSAIDNRIHLVPLTYYDELLNLKEFKVSIENILKENGDTYIRESIFSPHSISKIYEYTVLHNKFILSETFLNEIFENITYSVSSNFYFDTLDHDLKDEDIINTIKLINTRFNNRYITADEAPYIKNDSYNLLNVIQPRYVNKVFVPFCKYDTEKFEILFIYKYKQNDGSYAYRTCSISINRENYHVYFLCNNPGARLKENEDDQPYNIISSDTFYFFVKKFLTEHCGLKLKIHNSRDEKKLMFNFCNQLNKEMVEEYESELTNKIQKICELQIDEVASTLSSNFTLDDLSKEKIYKKIFSTYLGEGMTRIYDEEDLANIAQERKLPGYPTLINFVSSTSSKGRTKTKHKKAPLTFEEVYYSLNTDFSENQELDEWRISWFESYFFENAKTTDVSQTTIKITTNYFKVTNLNKTRKSKGMVLFIVETIRKHL